MRILFDNHIFSEQRVGGISRYFAAIAERLDAQPGINARVLAPFSRNAHLAAIPSRLVSRLRTPGGFSIGPMADRISDRLSAVIAPWLRADIVHETYFQVTPRIELPGARVTTVYDMIHEEMGLDAGFSAVKAAAVARCDHVICISEHTRSQLVERFGVSPGKTSVVLLASDDFGAIAGPAREHAGRPYLLHVGRRGGYKNFDVAIKALGAARGPAQEFDLVSFGRSAFRPADLERARGLGLDPVRLVHRSGSDAVLARLYRGAAAMIFPSSHEGFGLPLVEAMSAGCPVLCSARSCLPEIAGDAALYFDPDDAESVRDAIERIAGDTALRAQLVARGAKRFSRFSWDRCARETLDVYRRV